jgi:hypothetical protein
VDGPYGPGSRPITGKVYSNKRKFVPDYLKDWLDFHDQTLYIVNNTPGHCRP